MRDSPEILKSAAKYLEKYRKTQQKQQKQSLKHMYVDGGS